MKNKWAVVTGATSGIGRAIAEKLAQNGMNVIITGRRLNRLNEVANEIKTKFKVEAKILNFDIGKWSDCQKNFAELAPYVQNIEVLINNAGVALGFEHIQDGKVADWEIMIDTNIKGLLYFTRLIIPHMIAKNSGHIINIGSVSGRWTCPRGAIYSATKFAVRAISESMRMDLQGKNIRVTNIQPGMVHSEFAAVRLGEYAKTWNVYRGMTPLSPQDIAESVSWCLQRPKHVNISELVIYPTDQTGVGPTDTYRREGAQP